MRNFHLKCLGILGAILILRGSASPLHAQLMKGDVLIEAHYGLPNLITSIVRIAVQVGNTNFTASGIGPFGARILYQYEEKISAGFEFNYADSDIGYSSTGLDSLGNTVLYDYRFELPRMRFMARVDLILFQDETFDVYGTGGLGVNYTRVRFTTNDPDAFIEEYDLPFFLPVAYRIGMGGRFFVAPFLGIHGEIAIGGPFMSGGLTIKL